LHIGSFCLGIELLDAGDANAAAPIEQERRNGWEPFAALAGITADNPIAQRLYCAIKKELNGDQA
jgi:hypothetical protein